MRRASRSGEREPSLTGQAKGVLLTTLGVLAIVPDSLLIRLISADTLVVAFWRSALAGLVLTAFVLLIRRRAAFAALGELRWHGAAYAVAMATATLLFVVSVRTTSVANTVFIVSTAPVFSAIASRIFIGERISRRMIWTIAFSFCGIGIIASGTLGAGNRAIAGDLAALGTAVCLAIGYTAARSARRFSMVPAAAASQILLALTLAFFIERPLLAGADLAYALVLGCILIPLGAGLLSTGPRYITAAEVSLLLLLEAVLAPLLIWLTLGEAPRTSTLWGGCLVLLVLGASNVAGIRATHR